MTEWTTRQPRHIPEDELHAYLDQALSRSQCAEIETHLSACNGCQAQRASVAALRDRTTALLSGLAPRPVIIPPSYQNLREQNRRRLNVALWRGRIQRSGLWAAGVVAAVGAGWAARSVLDPHREPQPAVPMAQAPVAPIVPLVVPAASTDSTADLERQATPVSMVQARTPLLAVRQAGHGSFQAVVPAPTLQLASAVIPSSFSPTGAPASLPARSEAHGPFDRVWRVVPWEEALQMAGSSLPFIEGIPVVGVLFQAGAPGERPTVIVAQQDKGGEVINSIEGPVAKVGEVIQRQAEPEMHASEATRTPPDYVEGPTGMRRALRILTVTGRLPVDSLNALARLATIR